MNDSAINGTDYHVPKTLSIKKTVTPEKPIKDFNKWIVWIYKQVKKVA